MFLYLNTNTTEFPLDKLFSGNPFFLLNHEGNARNGFSVESDSDAKAAYANIPVGDRRIIIYVVR